MVLNLEELLERKVLFKDKNILEMGYTPTSLKDILHRDYEIEQYANALIDANRGGVPKNIFIYGKTGTGKTMLTNVILKQLKIILEKKNHDMIYLTIPCANINSKFNVLKYITRELEHINNVKPAKIYSSVDSYVERMFELIANNSAIHFFVFDEIDFLKTPELLNQLARIKENRVSDRNVCMIGITNNLNYRDQLDPRTKSALSDTSINFTPYDAIQLEDILRKRAELAFYPNTLDEDVIPLCSALSAKEHGDARAAIHLLSMAATRADEECKNKVSIEDVNYAYEHLHDYKFSSFIKSLPQHSKTILLSIKLLVENSNRSYTVKEIASIYNLICIHIHTQPFGYRTVHAMINELDMFGFVKVIKTSRGRGVNNMVTLMLDPDILSDCILEDNTFIDFKKSKLTMKLGNLIPDNTENKKISEY